jgi:hypothetical protein
MKQALRGHLGSTLNHIDGGVRILSELQSNALQPRSANSDYKSSSNPFAATSTLNALFARLDIQATGLVSTRPMRSASEMKPEDFGGTGEIPDVFHSLEEARSSQDYVFSHWMRALQTVLSDGTDVPYPETIASFKAEYTPKIAAWSSAFDALIVQRALDNIKSTPNDTQAIHMLQLQRIFMFIYADIDHSAAAKDETLWDVYYPQFSSLLSHAKTILDAIPKSRRKPLFSLDSGIVGPLYFVASRCRHPQIRREAIACLLSTNRQEGVWESQVVGRVAQRVMEIEESSVSSDELNDGKGIPAWARVHGVQPELDPDGRAAVLNYIRPPIQGTGGEGMLGGNVKEVIQW